MEYSVNTGRSVYKIDVIDDTVHPHAPVGHVYFGSMAHPKAAEGSGHSALASSKVELLVNLHHRNAFDNRVLSDTLQVFHTCQLHEGPRGYEAPVVSSHSAGTKLQGPLLGGALVTLQLAHVTCPVPSHRRWVTSDEAPC